MADRSERDKGSAFNGEGYMSAGIQFLKDLIKQHGAIFDSILEVGCGTGYITEDLSHFCKHVSGCDTSREVVETAIKKYTDISFFIYDITSEQNDIAKEYDVVVLNDLMWDVIDKCDQVRMNVLSLIKPGGYLLCMQSFPAVMKDHPGNELFPDPQSFVSFWSDLQIRNQCVLNADCESVETQLCFVGEKCE